LSFGFYLPQEERRDNTKSGLFNSESFEKLVRLRV